MSVLEKEHKTINRPYSQLELKVRRQNLRNKLNLGSTMANHDCGHFYLTKSKGRKEKLILEKSDTTIGCCSVCWKFGITPDDLKNLADKLIAFYQSNFYEEPVRLTIGLVEAESDFYEWLYSDFTN